MKASPSEELVDPANEAIPEGAEQPALDYLSANWIPLAASAWIGAVVHGPGAIVLTQGPRGVEFTYRPGASCPCHPIDTDTYDPETQVLIVVYDEGRPGEPFAVAGWPTPPECWALAPLETMEATLH